jgi:hypothetical protein
LFAFEDGTLAGVGSEVEVLFGVIMLLLSLRGKTVECALSTARFCVFVVRRSYRTVRYARDESIPRLTSCFAKFPKR